jgi:hypothetical protein
MDNDDDDEINLENIFKKQKELKTAYEEGESKAQ